MRRWCAPRGRGRASAWASPPGRRPASAASRCGRRCRSTGVPRVRAVRPRPGGYRRGVPRALDPRRARRTPDPCPDGQPPGFRPHRTRTAARRPTSGPLCDAIGQAGGRGRGSAAGSRIGYRIRSRTDASGVRLFDAIGILLGKGAGLGLAPVRASTCANARRCIGCAMQRRTLALAVAQRSSFIRRCIGCADQRRMTRDAGRGRARRTGGPLRRMAHRVQTGRDRPAGSARPEPPLSRRARRARGRMTGSGTACRA